MDENTPRNARWSGRWHLLVGLGLLLLSPLAYAAEASRVDPAARLPAGNSAGEAWDVSARFDDGARFFARFWITNEGPGERTGVVMGYLTRPDGSVADVKYGREKDNWTLAAGGRYLEIASGVLDLRGPTGRVEVDSNKYGRKIYLRFPMPAEPTGPCGGEDFEVVRLGAPVDGLYWVKGMQEPQAAKGTIAVTHSWGSASEIDRILRRIEVTGRVGDFDVLGISSLAPSGAETSCVAAMRGGRVVHEARGATLEVAPASAGNEGKYPLPSAVTFAGTGLNLTVEPGRELVRANPLDIVPQPFRLLLSVRSQPRRISTDSRLRLRLDGDKEAQGEGLATVTYTNPYSPKSAR